jgi:hypothetical protein
VPGPKIVEIKCPSHKHGTVVNGSGTFRVRCTGKFCRGSEGTVAFHTFDLSEGTLRTEHVPYRNPRELLGQGEINNVMG